MKNIFIVLLTVIFFTACNKTDIPEPIIPSAEYKINDSMALQSSYSISDPTFYNNYNNKTYNNTEINATANYSVDATGVTLQFQDNSATKGNSLSIKFLGKTTDNISGTYDLAGNSQIKYTQIQSFNGGTIVQAVPTPFISGSITINYSLSNSFVYGFIADAKHYFGIYVPYQTASSGITQSLAQVNTLQANQSTRKYNINFNYIKKL